jgi:FkbM family methyltransferase
MTGMYRRGGLRWRLDLDEGIDFSIYLLGAFEVPTVRFYRRMVRQGEVVIDIGANIGAHTLPLARCVGPSGKVHAFEPTAFAFQKLVENVSLNPEIKDVIICNHTLLVSRGDTHLPDQIYSSWPLSATPGLHPKHLGRLQPITGAAVEDLDSYCSHLGLDRVHWIKIDVDGHEAPVLRGASNMIRNFRPKMIMELSPYSCREAGYNFGELIALLQDADYAFVDLETSRPLPSDAVQLDALIPDGAGINVFLRPMSNGNTKV